jgi:uncharacterized membrane protein YfcA
LSQAQLKWIYPCALIVVFSTWAIWMGINGKFGLFIEHWEAAATMMFGSFVAGSTPAGGGGVAFPVFTKVLHVPASQATAFSLMIESVGMGMATILILSKKHKIVPNVILWVTLGGIVGQFAALFWALPSPMPRLLFTALAGTFGVAMAISRWGLNASPIDELRTPSARRIMLFLAIGLIGGFISAQFGSGINLIAFIVITLAFGLNEKVGIPTTVIIMAVNAQVWFAMHLMVLKGWLPSNIPPIPNEPIVWEYWLAAVPVVSLGAPFGAWAASKVKRDHLIVFLLALIGVEFISTAVILGPKLTSTQLWIVLGTVLLCCAWFWAMHRYRKITRPEDFA